MRYIMLVDSKEVPRGPSPEAIEDLLRTHVAVTESRQEGVFMGYDALKSTASGTTVRMNGGAPLVTDGPLPRRI
jgi:hypothetical protein